jgi:hypothetical protein
MLSIWILDKENAFEGVYCSSDHLYHTHAEICVKIRTLGKLMGVYSL